MKLAVSVPSTLMAMGVSLAACSTGETTVDVFAGSSLTEVLQTAEADFEAINDGVDIRLNLAGSNALARQISDGGTAELFIPADLTALDSIDPGLLGRSVPLAGNSLVMIAPADAAIPAIGPSPTPAEALAWAGSFARCATGVPCGDAADAWISAMSNLPSARTISVENNVRAVLAKVRTGEVDLGLVYRTDAIIAGDDIITIDLGAETPRTLVTGFIVNSGNRDASAAADRFLNYLAQDEAQRLFQDAGFTVP